MTTNPFVNALLGLGYIMLVASGLYYGPMQFEPEESVFVPIAMLSLFVLSASIMGYLFLYQPLMLFLAGERERGVKLFLQTIGIFACITFVMFLMVFIVSASL